MKEKLRFSCGIMTLISCEVLFYTAHLIWKSGTHIYTSSHTRLRN